MMDMAMNAPTPTPSTYFGYPELKGVRYRQRSTKFYCI